jgi:hypothetical protein
MKQVAPPSAKALQTYEAIGEGLARAGVESGQMFGMPVLKFRGQAVAGLFGDAMVFKLTDPAHAAARALAGAALFDPSGMGRPMKAWVVVPATHAARWTTLATVAVGDVGAVRRPSAAPAKAKAVKAKPAKAAPAKAKAVKAKPAKAKPAKAKPAKAKAARAR